MPQYFDPDPITASDRKLIDYDFGGIGFRFITDTNVFSRNGIDKGTDCLLKEVVSDLRKIKPQYQHFLDLGCGIGVVGIVLASRFPNCEIKGYDVNSRACGLAMENAELNKVRASFEQLDVTSGLPCGETYDAIITNPPVRAGKSTVFKFYEEAYSHLSQGGRLYVVLQRKQGAGSSKTKLEDLFGNCTTLGITGGYHVMKAEK